MTDVLCHMDTAVMCRYVLRCRELANNAHLSGGVIDELREQKITHQEPAKQVPLIPSAASVRDVGCKMKK